MFVDYLTIHIQFVSMQRLFTVRSYILRKLDNQVVIAFRLLHSSAQELHYMSQWGNLCPPWGVADTLFCVKWGFTTALEAFRETGTRFTGADATQLNLHTKYQI